MCCTQGRSGETETYSEHTEIPSIQLASYIAIRTCVFSFT